MLKLIILHFLICILGFLSLRFFFSQKKHQEFNYLIFSYPLGLMILGLAVFTLNQFAAVTITYQSILSIILFIGIALAQGFYFSPSKVAGNLSDSQFPNLSASLETDKYIRILNLVCAISLVFFVVFMSLITIYEPLGDWDTLMYHLPIARHIFKSGSFPSEISPTMTQMENAYPPLYFFLYSLNWIGLGGTEFASPEITFVLINLLSLLIFYKIQHQLRGVSFLGSGLSAILLVQYFYKTINGGYYWAQPNMYSLVLLYFLAGLYFLFSAGIHGSRKNFYLATIFWAGAYWTNYLGLMNFAVIITGFVIFYLASRSKEIITFQKVINFKTILVCGLIFLLIISPHFLRNWIKLGNPLYPGFNTIFGGYLLDDWATKYLVGRTHRPDLKLLEGIVWGRYSLTFIVTVLACLEINRKKWFSFFVPFYIFLYVTLWAFFLQNSFVCVFRYLVLAYGVIYLFIGGVVDKILTGQLKNKSFYWLLGIGIAYCFINLIEIKPLLSVTLMIIIVYLLSRGQVSQIYKKYYRQLVKIASIGALLLAPYYLYVNLNGGYANKLLSLVKLNPNLQKYSFGLKPDMDWIDQNLPPDSKILTLEPRLFFLTRDYVPGDHPQLKNFYESETLAQALQELEQRGITHLYPGILATFTLMLPYQPFRQSIFFKSLNNKVIFEVIYDGGLWWRRIYKIKYDAVADKDL